MVINKLKDSFCSRFVQIVSSTIQLTFGEKNTVTRLRHNNIAITSQRVLRNRCRLFHFGSNMLVTEALNERVKLLTHDPCYKITVIRMAISKSPSTVEDSLCLSIL